MDFWERVKERLVSIGKTQAWLAEQIEEPDDKVRRWSSRGTIPDVVQASRIAEALLVTVEYLVAGKDSESELRTGSTSNMLHTRWAGAHAELMAGLVLLNQDDLDEILAIVRVKREKMTRTQTKVVS